ncbi:T9SS type A sorting domain-containing protein [Crocinitomix sp.]|nr:T9SS type A sorting domain-containing protein [Crocinitomix sp.]
MNSIKYILLLLISLPLTGLAQDISFIKAYGNLGYDYGRDIKQDTDTGYVVTGSSSSFGPDNGEAFILKIDKNGEFLWSHNYGGPGADWGESLVITNDSTYAIGGYTNSSGAGGFDFYLVRINADGTPQWESTYGGEEWDQAFGLVQLADSGFVLAGESYSFNDGIRSGYIVRTDKDGAVLWEKYLDEDVESFFTDIDIEDDSLVLCGGIGDGGEESFDGLVYKCHIDGTFGWQKAIGREYNDYFNAIDIVGGVYGLGGARGYNYPTEKENMWMYRMSNIGEELLDTVYINESLEPDIVHDVILRAYDQDFYYIGQTQSYGYLIDGLPDVFMGKMTAIGVHFAANNYGEAGVDIGRALDITKDNAIIFLAETQFFSTGGNDLLIIKLDAYWNYPPAPLLESLVTENITSSILETKQTIDLGAYPNPFIDIIQIPTLNQPNIQVIGIDGKIYFSEKNYPTTTIDLGALTRGTYFLRIESENKVYQQKLIKY